VLIGQDGMRRHCLGTRNVPRGGSVTVVHDNGLGHDSHWTEVMDSVMYVQKGA
jgi:hypothetical protein